MLENLSRRIRHIGHILMHDLFLNEERRVRLKTELSKLLDMRDGYLKHQEQVRKDKKARLKDPDWGRR